MKPHARHSLAAATCLVGMVWYVSAGAATPDVANTPTSSAQAAAEQAVRERFSLPGSRIEVAAMALNPRLQLTPCGVPLRTVIARSSRAAPRVAVSVRCPQAGGWSTRVTVKLQLFRRVLVTNHPLLRGDGLGVADVHAEERDVTHLGYGYIENIEQVAGRTLSRALPSDSVLTPAALGGRRMVRAGDHVQMIARLGGIEVRANGVALGSGDNGARLRVRNAGSGKVIDGMVSAPGEVIALP
jgi:flagella basal body P-ring formation protein FlgA